MTITQASLATGSPSRFADRAITSLERYALLTSVTVIALIDLSARTPFAIPVIVLGIAPLILVVAVNHRHFARYLVTAFSLRGGGLQRLVVLLWPLLMFMFVSAGLSHTISAGKTISLVGLWTILIAAAISIAGRPHTAKVSSRLAHSVLGSLQAYVVLNAVLYGLGVPPIRKAYEVAGRAAMLDALGLHVDRVYFLALGINGFGSSQVPPWSCRSSHSSMPRACSSGSCMCWPA